MLMSEPLVAFLREQLDVEFEAPHAPYCAGHDGDDFNGGTSHAFDGSLCDCGWPARVLADIDAKKRILEQHKPVTFTNITLGIVDATVCWVCHSHMDYPHDGEDHDDWEFPLVQDRYPCLTVRLLALPYADRPGFQESWRP